jgi:hypothetical protein
MNKSKFLSLNAHDFLKGAIIAVVTPVLVLIQEILSNGVFELSPKQIIAVGVSGFIAYLLKNLFEGEDKKVELKAQKLASMEGEGEEVVTEEGFVGSRPTDRERNKKRG